MSDHPDNHKDFEDRLTRAVAFREKYGIKFELYVDYWSNEFENLFQAWPDKYYLIDSDKKVLERCEHNEEAQIINDYAKILAAESTDTTK